MLRDNHKSAVGEATPEYIHRSTERKLPDIKPITPIATLDREAIRDLEVSFKIEDVAQVVGLSPTFIKKVVGGKSVDAGALLALMDQDAFAETFVPRSRIVQYLLAEQTPAATPCAGPDLSSEYSLEKGDALDVLRSLPDESVQCVVTSTPYWGLRIYKESTETHWADGISCPLGHEQTPEEFIRHTAQILAEVQRVLTQDGSVWWNLMDSFNTRTQIRGNAAEALRAMQGKDKRTWKQHDCRRYSAGHAFLKDGEQCLIPTRIAERASRMGFYVKTLITWAKTGSLPEPQNSRVSRNLEYIIHLAKVRTPKFNKAVYRQLPASLGGRNNGWETDKLSDVWTLHTSNGRDGHGAQFPVALPGRCVALSTDPGDLVLDPFVGAGNAGVAAVALGRRFFGIDVSAEYLETARRKLEIARLDRGTLPIEQVPDAVTTEKSPPDLLS